MFNPETASQTPRKDHPLSAQGRFNRLSYLGWYGLLSLSCMLAFILIITLAGSFSVNKALLHKPICKGFFSDIIFK